MKSLTNCFAIIISYRMPWQGQKDNLIDRFDVRAHLDYIPPQQKKEEDQQQEKVSEQERQVNYECFRVLAQNDFLGINETDFLRQINIEEQFGSTEKSIDSDKNKKKNSQLNAAIGYTYEDSSSTPNNTVPFSQQILSIETSTTSSRYEECAKDCSDESENDDIDVSVDVKKVGPSQAHELNNFGKKYGMVSNDLFSFLTRDEDEKISLKAMKEQEADKIMGGGRKSRRERRSQREKRILGKPFTLSPPSYAAKEEKAQGEDEDEEDEESEKSSRNSKSPSVEKITYITSFGGEEELQPHSKISIPFGKTLPKNLVNLRRNESFADMVKENAEKLQHMNQVERRKYGSRRRSSRSSSRRRRSSRSSSRQRRYRSRTRSRSRGRRYRSRSRSRRRNYRRSSSYSSRERRRRRSRRRSGSYRRRSLSRSRSRDRGSYKKSLSRKQSQRKSTSRERSRRAYSSSSTSSTSSSSSSSTSARSNTSSPEKKVPVKKSPSKEKSKSKSIEKEIVKAKSLSVEKADINPPPTTVKRYYGRKRDDDSSSSLTVDSDDDDNDDKKQIGSNDR
jgi:splicing factor, arginine/serine-rich 16